MILTFIAGAWWGGWLITTPLLFAFGTSEGRIPVTPRHFAATTLVAIGWPVLALLFWFACLKDVRRLSAIAPDRMPR